MTEKALTKGVAKGGVKSPTIKRPIIGSSAPVQEMLKLIHRVAATKTNILIIGESGTGKELVARMIHEAGPLAPKPFVPVNCGAIPPTLIESELFGHKKGSFTGAIAEKMGLFEVAQSGTIFLDEVGELPLPMQVKLLRTIQERAIKKVGGTEDVRVDVRIIAATNRDLEAGVVNGTFREDLYYRLNVIQIKTPPLREREEDVRILAEHFLKKCVNKYSSPIIGFDPEAMAALMAYDWPGNVRELENVIERSVTLQTGKKVTVESLSPNIRQLPGVRPGELSLKGGGIVRAPDFSRGAVSLVSILREVELVYLKTALERGGTQERAAALLGLKESEIGARLKEQGIPAGKRK